MSQPSSAPVRYELAIAGLDCPDCAAKLAKGLGQLPGVHRAQVVFSTGKAYIEVDEASFDPAVLPARVAERGYELRDYHRMHAGSTLIYRVDGLDCADCAEKVRKRVSRIPGVSSANMNFAAAKLTVVQTIAPELVLTAVEQAGYHATLEGGTQSKKTVFKITGLDCADCAKKLETRVSHLPGVNKAEINFAAGKIIVDSELSPDLILKVVDEAGYHGEAEGSQGPRATELRVSGLDCADCAEKLRQRLAKLPGVSYVELSFAAGKLSIEHTAPLATILTTVSEAGYQAELANRNTAPAAIEPWWANRRTQLTIASGILSGLGFALEAFHLETAAIISFLAAMVTGGFYVARSGFYALKSFSLDMNFLMTVAAIGAAAIGQWDEAATVVFLFSLGNSLQAYTMDKTRQSIRALMDLAPKEALIRREGHELRLPVDEVMVGDVMIVKPGEKVAMDGIVLAGHSAVNQAPITGESIPVDKNEGDEVFDGTINQQGSLDVRVTRNAGDNTLARILHMVEEAQGQRAPSQQFVEVFARYYTPIVTFGAVALTIIPPLLFGQPFSIWFYRSLQMLVISCPCALVISTPVSIVSAIGNASKQGILVKGGAYLEAAGALKVIAFDKTGTLTTGRPVVVDFHALRGDREAVLAIAAALEQRSEHPLAEAIVAYAKQTGVSIPAVNDFTAVVGKGATGRVADEEYWIGSPRLLAEQGHGLVEAEQIIAHLQEEGKTAILLGDRQGVLGVFGLADELRANAAQAVARLRRAGIQHVVMLTGDNRGTAQAVAKQAGVDEYRAELLPQDKLSAVKTLLSQYGQVAMVGDGVNDAPALATATVGIAMGAAGTDAALETADMALMGDDLSKVAYAMDLSRRTLTIIKENIVFSLVTKLIVLGLAVVGLANLWLAVFADTGTALIVIANGMRLMRVRPVEPSL
ncbi:MAG: heavy metal translocating P-type ATPase [Bacillota bacterium]